MPIKKIKVILGSVLSLTLVSCISIGTRTPANDNERLSLREMQLLSKDATFRFFKSDATRTEAQAFQLSDTEKIELAQAVAKLKQILHRPIIVNLNQDTTYENTGIDRSNDKKEIRITSWNIERGQQIENIKNILSLRENGKCNLEKAASNLNWRKDSQNRSILDTTKKDEALAEACALNESDVLILNEADYGICRSGYKAVAAELANHLNMNYVYAPSFFEAEPAKSGLAPAESKYCKEENLEATRNLTGNAILSRYPLTNIKVVPLPIGYLKKDGSPASKNDHDAYCYDWYTDEIKGPTLIDKGVRVGAKIAFNEDIGRELRYGSRNAIVADIQLPTGIVTVVAAHLENKAKPSCRQAQMRHLIKQINSPHPIVIGGDMNTTGSDGGHHSVAATVWDLAIGQTVESHGFWFRLFDVSVPFLSTGITAGKTTFSKLTLTQNPTRRDLKWLRPNPEGHLFSYLKDEGFVFKGNKDQSVSRKNEGPWSTTNSRDKLGFEGTHYLNKTYLTEGISKLDWFFVKTNGNKCSQPKFPRTLGRLRDGLGAENFPSDHVPISLILEAPCN